MTSDDDRRDDPSGPTAAAVLANPDLDPVLAAKLRSWFSDGASSEPAESEASPAQARKKRLEEILEVADDGLLDRLQADRTISRDYESLATPLDRSVEGFREVVRTRLRIPELHTAQIPNDVLYIIKDDNTPQALLRDLHRPVWDFDPGAKQILLTLGYAGESVHGPAVKQALDFRLEPVDVAERRHQAYAAMTQLRTILDTDHFREESPENSREETTD